MNAVEDDLRSDRIIELSTKFSGLMRSRIEEITSVNRLAKMLSMNAMVVAARAGEAGKGFSLLAEEYKKLSSQIDSAVSALDSQAQTDLDELTNVSSAILEHVRKQRLTDLALNAIEIIDRNLYERTCDVRWWATDSAVVSCLEAPSREAFLHAGSRLKVILDAYTVYIDLWICDLNGQVMANGRPDRYPDACGLSVSNQPWFSEAIRLRSGDEFVAGEVFCVGALENAPAATYATAIRAGGQTKGKTIGVLGIHFDWRPQAQAVVDGVRLNEEERTRSRVMILDQKHRILASSDGMGALNEVFPLETGATRMGAYAQGDATIGYAQTPGYETYRGLGWFGCLVQSKRPLAHLKAVDAGAAA